MVECYFLPTGSHVFLIIQFFLTPRAGDSSLTSKLDQNQWTLQQGDVCEWCVSQSEGEEVKTLEEVGQMVNLNTGEPCGHVAVLVESVT